MVTVKDLIGNYKDEIVPLLDQKHYELAGHELYNLCFAVSATIEDLGGRHISNPWLYPLQLYLSALQRGCLDDEISEGTIGLLRKSIERKIKFIEPDLDRLV